jgi:lipopolysaccharide/colanic/teichoic acid biosynthesis glycosyltransferase
LKKSNVERTVNPGDDSHFLSEDEFVHRLELEQRRTERSRRSFVLVLLESRSLFKPDESGSCHRVQRLLASSIRQTDIRGWYVEGTSIGLIFTEVPSEDGPAVGNALARKVRQMLLGGLTSKDLAELELSFYVFPDDWDKGDSDVLYPTSDRSRRLAQVVKRCIDIGGSMAAIAVASPLFLLIAAAIKLSSPGPVFFRQKRVGLYGREFTFLKFRSMHVNNDHGIHREYVKNLIAGEALPGTSTAGGGKVYKLSNDPRVTRIGRFLRRTSLDEVPQFLNVLMGQMSLVGPRPPIPYEVEAYDLWHRRRLLEVKPGITGLWQVHGRSRTTFDEMVRLDLRYANSWTIWLDLKILMQTPRAVAAGDGAY